MDLALHLSLAELPYTRGQLHVHVGSLAHIQGSTEGIATRRSLFIEADCQGTMRSTVASCSVEKVPSALRLGLSRGFMLYQSQSITLHLMST